MNRPVKFSLAALFAVLVTPGAIAAPAMPRYAHIFVIIEENHTTDQIIGNTRAPVLNQLAKQFGLASNYYAVSHPSEPNYVALLGGDTFAIRDDDAYYCKPGMKREGCGHSDASGYVDHTTRALGLAKQLSDRGLSWKGYFEDIPRPGSLLDRQSPYVAKHNGFMNFRDLQDDPRRADKIVGFDALYRDIAAGTLPNFAHIVPSLCDDMHGAKGPGLPKSCTDDDWLVAKADATVGKIVDKITGSAMWNGTENDAIVITFDEYGGDTDWTHAAGCCGFGPRSTSNPGGGWIATIVITNHGPRHLNDPKPYNHYSLLRTIEDCFGIPQHLRHAADTAMGVVSMTPLFAVSRK